MVSNDLQCPYQTSADSAVRILSGTTVRCLLVKIKFKFEIRTLENPPDWKFKILTDRHHTVIPDRIRTALSADVWSLYGPKLSFMAVDCLEWP